MLQTQVFKIEQVNEPCIKVDIRELNRVLGTMYLPIYIN